MNSAHRGTYIKDEQRLPFCRGCGHLSILKSLDKALVKLQKDPREVVVVTDIGCIGLADIYINTNAFHGLHGRSVTYGCGLKLARPELTVIVLQGDGGCGIGGTHLLNVARRNIGITLIVGNNFNYGMTGGQHSVTTPTEAITSTTPWGNVEGPMDLCGIAAAAGGSWIYRATAFDRDLPDIMARAIEQPGFAMLDVWELCMAYYSPRNQLKKNDLFQLMERYGLKTGLVADSPRPEYSALYRAAYEKGRTPAKTWPAIEKEFSHTTGKQTGIVVAGAAGQKIKSTATLFAKAALFSGLEATQKDDYPVTVMTGHSISEIILSPEPIEHTAVESPDYFVVIAEEGAARAKEALQSLPQTCIVLADEGIALPDTKAKVERLAFRRESMAIDKLTIATVALAALLKRSGLFPLEAFKRSVGTFQRPEIAEKNRKAIDTGALL